MRTQILLTFVTYFFCSCSSNHQKIPCQDLDLVINKTMQENHLPGLAIAIVKDDSIIFAKGYGVRKLGESATENISTPYYVKNEKVLPTEWEETGIYDPADAIISNVIDLANYIKLYLNNGIFENDTVINSETLDQIQMPQIITASWAKEYFNPEANFMTFGSGCAVSDYKGVKIIQMAGMISGSTSLLTLVPSEKTGIAIQTNMAGALSTFVPVNYKIIDDLLSHP